MYARSLAECQQSINERYSSNYSRFFIEWFLEVTSATREGDKLKNKPEQNGRHVSTCSELLEVEEYLIFLRLILSKRAKVIRTAQADCGIGKHGFSQHLSLPVGLRYSVLVLTQTHICSKVSGNRQRILLTACRRRELGDKRGGNANP